MSDEQKVFLARRLEEAAKLQPELKSLRQRLLASAGLDFVPPAKPDSDLPELLDSGRLIVGPVARHELDEGHCHENVAELWLDRKHLLTAIGTGYALSEDGLWRQHSWGMRGDEIVETTAARSEYFGCLLSGGRADAFATANRGDAEARRWRRLPEIWFRLEKDAEGFPPKEWEGLKSEPTGVPDIYRVQCTPFFARGVAYDDQIVADKADDGDYLIFRKISTRSGYSTIRLWMEEGENSDAIRHSLIEMGCLVEAAPNFGNRLIAIAVPPAVFDNVEAFISRQCESGRLEAEDGYIAGSGA